MGPVTEYGWYVARDTDDHTVEFMMALCRLDRSRGNPTIFRGPLKPGVNCERMSPDEAQTKAFHEAAARFQTALEKH